MAAAIIFAVLSALSSAGSAVLQRFAAVDHKSKAAAAGTAAGPAWLNAINLYFARRSAQRPAGS